MEKTSKPWHAMGIEETLKTLNTREVGLSREEAQKRLAEYGPNELKKEKGISPIRLFLEQFADILILILLIATGLSIYLGEITDAIVIIAIVLACAILGFVEEYRSEKALEALKKMTAPTAMVLRDGKEVKVQASEIVPGDIILLYTGDKVPADARLIEAINLKVDEAPLTGESTPVNKSVDPLPEETGLPERRNIVFTGTAVVYGRGKAVVTSTGMNTEFGKIAKMVQVTEEEETPLEKRMASVGKWIGILCIAVCLTVAAIGIAEGMMGGRNPLDIAPTMILWGVSLAVAAVPEALPAIVTGALAVGMYRMAKVNTIVRRLPAVETLGCTSVICADKTGTMTKGEMTVQRIYVNDQNIKVSGVGYEPEGEFMLEDKKLDPAQEEELIALLKISALCNDAMLEKEKESGRWIIKGDPTEGALVVVAAKAGLLKEELEKETPRIGEVPFSSERKRMTTVHKASKRKMAFMKGAPEIVLERCTKILSKGKVRKITQEDREKILKINEAMAMQALRNLGFAYKELPESVATFDEKIENEMTFVGIMGMIDPPREEVKDAISLCRNAGIQVVMVTGDHKLTAVAVAKELNLISENDADKVLTGQELDKISDEQLTQMVENVVIYARVSPEHKMRIVKAWKAKGYVVAMTGDGVNDAPALKLSDIGVAMGITGTEVTKEASDMVLTDDNFASIVKAVKEGREIYDNIKKYLTYLLRCNIMEILVMFIVMIGVPYIAGSAYTPGEDPKLSPTVALTAIQLLWVNLVTDGLPALALGIDPGDPDLMERKPRDPKESVFTRDVKIYLTAVPIMMTGLLLTGYFMHQPWLGDYNLLEARTQLLTAMILMELANAISARSLKYPVFKVGVFKNKFLWVAVLSSLGLQLMVLYTPFLQDLFDVHTPELIDWAFAILFTAIVFGSLELGKYVASKKRKT
ncbi:MAG: cation-translocating P-type ATPase [Candidatus Bathycorpusculaceae bacterium]